MKTNMALRGKVCPNPGCTNVNAHTAVRCVDPACGADLSAVPVTLPPEFMLVALADEMTRRQTAAGPVVIDNNTITAIATASATATRADLTARPIEVRPVVVHGLGNGVPGELRQIMRAGATDALNATPVELSSASHDMIVNDVNSHTDGAKADLTARHDTTDETLAALPKGNGKKSFWIGFGAASLAALVVILGYRTIVSNESMQMVTENPATITVQGTVVPSTPPTAPPTAAPVSAPATQSTMTRVQCIQYCVQRQTALGFDQAKATAVCSADLDCVSLN